MPIKALIVMALTNVAAPLQAAGTDHCWAHIQAINHKGSTIYVGDKTTQPFKLMDNADRMFGPTSATGIYVKSSVALGDSVNVILYDQRP